MLEVRDIYKKYEGKPLLEGVSFTVNKGETICLLGTSGSGKSTLLRIISGLEIPDSGSVLWNGADLATTPPYQRRFGLMFQDYALFPHRTVFQNVAFGLRMQKLPAQEIQDRTEKSLRTINMLDFASRRVTDLSGGEQQRVALARALAPDPHLLMLDEPLGALDRSLREQLSQELRRVLHETDLPAIYVTHDQSEAFAIADRLLILHEGRIIQAGSPQEIYQAPASAWVANFFGLGNLIPGSVHSVNPFAMDTPLGTLQVVCDGQLPSVGEKRVLLLRPSEARVCPMNENPVNCISGTVSDSIFQGEAYRLSLRAQNGITIFIQAAQNHPRGSRLGVYFPPEKIQCLPE
jgi:spermidine/putrescine transport system ATP-binding protein